MLAAVFAGSDAERLYVAVIRKRASETNEHLMVTDKKARIVYITSKVMAAVVLLGFLVHISLQQSVGNKHKGTCIDAT